MCCMDSAGWREEEKLLVFVCFFGVVVSSDGFEFGHIAKITLWHNGSPISEIRYQIHKISVSMLCRTLGGSR